MSKQLYYVGTSRLLLAGWLGGFPACCWILLRNELPLRSELLLSSAVRVPWRLLAVVSLLLEAGLLQAALFAWIPWWVVSTIELLLIAAVALVAHTRFAGLGKRNKPLDPQSALQVGWCFVALRAVPFFGLMYCVR